MENIQRALDLAAKQRATSTHSHVHAHLHAEDPATAERSAVRREFTAPPIEPATRLMVDWNALRDSRIIDRDDARPASHAYRMLRTQVLQRARAHGISTIGIVSAANGEGKTLTAINLSLSLAAEPNQSVLLIDLDLRRPSVANTLRLPVDRGLESWFAGTATIEELWHGVEGVERLFLLPTLRPVPASSEALARATTKKLLQDLKERDPGRILIVDLPPVLLSDDALTLVPQLDAVILIVAEGCTRREDVARVLELLGNTRVIGTVLNRSSESETRAY